MRLLVRLILTATMLLGVPLAPATAAATAGTRTGAAAKVKVKATLTLSPQPGTPDALPQTQLSILGVPRSAIVSVSATGSRTGGHAGQLRGYSAGDGASFVPDEPFAAGERVRVRLAIRGQRVRVYSFGIGRPVSLSPVLSPHGPIVLDPKKLDHFVSDPVLLAPRFTVLHRSPALRGSLLITPLPSPTIHPGSRAALTIKVVGPGGPMIVTPSGRLVWFDQLPSPMVAADLQMQRYAGHTVLTWWQGGVEPQAFGRGEGIIVNHSYHVVATVRAGNGYNADIHELELLPGRRALITAYAPVRITIRRHGRREQITVLDSVVQEIDVPTGLVMWEWDGLGHIPLSSTYAVPHQRADWDPFHLNAIQMLGHGRVLVSARDTSAVYEVDQASGRIVWTLGGKRSSFTLAPGARFHLQHDARLYGSGSRLSLFDDEAGPPDYARSSRGLILSLDLRSRAAAVYRQLHRRTPTLANSEGSVQTLADGGFLVGFGSTRFVSGFDRAGRLTFDSELPTGDSTYRAFLANWHATPSVSPLAVSEPGADGTTLVHVSWNGATDVARWEVLADGREVASAADRSFETAIHVPAGTGPLTIRALTQAGETVGPPATLTADK